MPNREKQSSILYALLIGASCYLPNRLSNGKTYKNLSGSVLDILQVEEYLRSMRGLPDERILKLTSTNVVGKRLPYETLDRLPTYENIVAAFRQITSMARPGEQVYIHFSGHGGRAKTLFPDLKGPNGIDETLVPVDIGSPKARYFRDVELAYLVQEMVRKELLVTLVLDSCHSGGATRGEERLADVRGLGLIDTTPRPTENLVAPYEELIETWQRMQVGTIYDIEGSGWLPKPKSYVLLAACLSHEKAYEYPFDGKKKMGALTYWLLDTLKWLRPGTTYKQLHDILLAKVHGQFRWQTPQLEGDGNRVVFDDEHVQSQYAVTVIRKDMANRRVLLNAGQVHPIGNGAEFVLLPSGVIGSTEGEEKLARVRVDQLGATESWATIIQALHSDQIQDGFPAVLIKPGGDKLRSIVKLQRQGSLPSSIDQDTALKYAKSALIQYGIDYVQVVEEEVAADYFVTITADGNYIIGDYLGNVFNIRPILAITNTRAPSILAQRLIHLTKYHNVYAHHNVDSKSSLKDKLVVQLIGKQQNYSHGVTPQLIPLDISSSVPLLQVGEWLFLRIWNTSADPLNVTVLDLQPDWSITQVPLYDSDIYFMSFDPDQQHILPLQVNLPSGYRNGKEVIKIVATRGTTSFRWLELPALDQPQPMTRGVLELVRNAAKRIWLTVNIPTPISTEINAGTFSSQQWVIVQKEVFVRRPYAS